MATPQNERDVLLQGADARSVNPLEATILLRLTPTVFHVDTAGNPTPASATVTATLLGLTGDVQLSVNGAALTNVTKQSDIVTTASIAFSSMAAQSATVTATLVSNGQTYVVTDSITKIQDGSIGSDGASFGTAMLYQWSTVQPALPTGSSSFGWDVGANTFYGGNDEWKVGIPANPGGALLKLWVAQKPVTAKAGTTSTVVTYDKGALVAALSQNGADGKQGAAGVKSKTVTAYRWATGPAPTTAGTATFTWATNKYDTPPSNWTQSKTDAPAAGYTLYEASVNLLDNTGAASTPIDWSGASIVGISYMAMNGVGTTGDSAMVAYVLVDGNSLAATPDASIVAGKNLPKAGTASVPGAWGETRAWQGTPPVPGVNQSVFQSNGIYSATNNNVTWGVPYLSVLRVGSLSAISANLGIITAGSINIGNGNAVIDSNGKATFRAIEIQNSDGTVLLKSGGVLADIAVPNSAKNSALVPSIAAAAQAGVFTAMPGYTFEFITGSEGFYGSNGATATFANGIATLKSTNTDPNFIRDSLNIPGATYDKVRMRIRRTAGSGWDGLLFYWNANHGFHGSFYQGIAVDPTILNKWVIVEWDMGTSSNPADWAGGTTTSLRFDLGNSAADVFDIDWISVGTTKPVTLSGIGFTGDANANYTTNTSQLTDGAGLGTTAVWNNVASKPADSAIMNSYISLGGNLLYNADFANGLDGWTVTNNGTQIEGPYYINAEHADTPGLDWAINRGVGIGSTTMAARQNGTSTSAYFEMQSQFVPLETSKRYVASAYTGAHRCSVDVFVYMYDISGNIVGNFGNDSNYNNEEKAGGQTITGYKRHEVAFTAPANAASARLVLRKLTTNQGKGYGDSWMFVSRTQLEQVAAAASAAGPWNPPAPSAAVYGAVAKSSATINAITNDGILDRSEKAQLRTEWAAEDAAWNALRTQAIALGLDVSQYDQAHNAASSYLVNLSPGWADTTQDTVINRQTFINTFSTMYQARAALQNSISAKASQTASWSNVANRPEDPSNLIKKGWFDDGKVGTWANGTCPIENVASPGANFPYTKNLWINQRDIYEDGNAIPVTPGETLYFGAWLETTLTDFISTLGVRFDNKNGAVLLWAPGASLAGRNGWTYREGTIVVPNGATIAYPWVQMENNGASYSNQFLRFAGLWIGRHARGATVGATFGKDIKGYMDSNNIGNYIAANSITDVLIGGNLKSTNWNGSTGPDGAGWLLERSTGNFYGNSSRLRGAIMSGDFTGWAWPGAGGGGYYLGNEGLLLGSANGAAYFQVTREGNMYSRTFNIINGNATFSGALSSMTATIGTLRTAASGGRTEISDNVIKVFDDSNVMRVRLGNLSL